VLLLGVGSLGIEIAKNIVLSGVKRLSIYDTRVIQKQDLYGQFFIGASDIGSNRAEACVEKVQQLNYYV
jgi:molybdopterin/thiamine biosynthesis adenylyltransferase